MTKQQIRNWVIAIAILAAGIIGIITTAWPSWGDPIMLLSSSGSIVLKSSRKNLPSTQLG